MWHTYSSKTVWANGQINWTKQEDKTWSILIQRQMETIQNRACQEFIDGLNHINFDTSHVPQHVDMSSCLLEKTGWKMVPVPALIPDMQFYNLLSRRHFPWASFIRVQEELDYLEEPDIFHEFFWHAPLLTWQRYADFLEDFGQFILRTDKRFHKFIFRIFWFSIEFWLIDTTDWMRIYGAWILSSHGETIRALEDPSIEKLPFDILTCARTPYSYDIMQSKYFFIQDFDELFSIFDTDLTVLFEEAILLWDIS